MFVSKKVYMLETPTKKCFYKTQQERSGCKMNEREILENYLNNDPLTLKESDAVVKEANDLVVKKIKRVYKILNPVPEEKIGSYRDPHAKKIATTDINFIQKCIEKNKEIPGFLEAGPRRELIFNPYSVKVAILTSGGLAPGLNSVVHSIVERHWETYKINSDNGGSILGIKDSFIGLYEETPAPIELTPDITEKWIGKGGSFLGNRRFRPDPSEENEFIQKIIANLKAKKIQILYIIGGDGSLTMAHKIAKKSEDIAVVGIPKTMDNDILWIWHSFGFDTTVERAARIVSDLHIEVESTRRICIVELFGAKSGFVAANTTLASGIPDLVIIPEEFNSEHAKKNIEKIKEGYVQFLKEKMQIKRQKKDKSHMLIVIAEGVNKVLGVDFVNQFKVCLETHLTDTRGRRMQVIVNQPRHIIRATPASAQDHIHCKHLGAFAVDSALAGYTDFMISQWKTDYVLVPLKLVAEKQKRVNLEGILWKQVKSITQQPSVDQMLSSS
jgi:6-phosphofructokinase 1